MKTLKIAALGVAALGFAALPVAGVMAAADGDQTMNVTETIAATVSPTCGLYDAWTDADTNTPAVAKNFSKTMINGQTWNLESDSTFGSKYIVVCNDEGGWEVKAVGSGEATGGVDKMKPSVKTTEIATGTTASGAAGSWAFKIAAVTSGTGAGATTAIAGSYDSYSNVPTTPQKVVSNPKATDKAASFSTGYQVYIGTETPADTYTGKVTYTLAHPATGA